MSENIWPHFVPVWHAMREMGHPAIVSGGYGLFLKQRWLLARAVPPTVVGRENWPANRATGDFDLLTQIDLIVSKEAQEKLHEVLRSNGFDYDGGNKRWGWEKKLEGGKVKAEFNADPSGREDDVRVKNYRIQPPESFGFGIHGRENNEMAGVYAEGGVYEFEYDGVSIAVPNPMTWAVMKLKAVDDRLKKSQNPDNNKRQVHAAQAPKHAEDVWRIAAMITLEERDQIKPELLKEISSGESFAAARMAFKEQFLQEDGLGVQIARRDWEEEDITTMQQVLERWFA